MSRSDVVGIGAQPDMRTGATAVAFAPPVTGASPEINRQNMEINETLGSRAPVAQEYGGRVFTIPMAGALRPRSGGLILSGFFGIPESTVHPDEPTAHVHEYDPLENLPIFSSIWARTDLTHLGQGHILDKFIGCRGNTINLSLEANNYFLFDASYAAREWLPDPAPPSFTRDASGRWSFKTTSIEMAVGSGAYTEIPSKAFTMSYNNNVSTDDFIIGDILVDSLATGDIEFTGSFTPTTDIKGHTRRAMIDDPEDIKLRLKAEGPVIAGSVRHALEIEIFRIETLTAAGNAINASENLRSVEVSWRGVLDDTTGKLFTLKLTNDEDGSLYS